MDHAAVAKNGVRFTLILLKRILLSVRHIRLIISLIVVKMFSLFVNLLGVFQVVYRSNSGWVPNNYKSNDRIYLNRHSYFQERNFHYFNGNGHSGFLENVSKRFIDKASPSDPEKREIFWMQTLKTIIPRNLNVFVSSGWPNIDCHKFSVIAFFTFGTRSSCKD